MGWDEEECGDEWMALVDTKSPPPRRVRRETQKSNKETITVGTGQPGKW